MGPVKARNSWASKVLGEQNQVYSRSLRCRRTTNLTTVSKPSAPRMAPNTSGVYSLLAMPMAIPPAGGWSVSVMVITRNRSPTERTIIRAWN